MDKLVAGEKANARAFLCAFFTYTHLPRSERREDFPCALKKNKFDISNTHTHTHTLDFIGDFLACNAQFRG